MSPPAERAAAYQAMGFFERLISASGATECNAEFRNRGWEGDAETLLVLKWVSPR